MDKMSKLPLPINVLELELGELFIIKGGLTPDSSGLLSGIGCGCGCSNGTGCGCGCNCEPLE